MGKKMRRGKQQVMFNYLPGKTFEFERVSIISRVQSIRGIVNSQLNEAVILNKIADEVSAWSEEFRPGLRDSILSDPTRFVILDPKSVQAELYPRVFWCQNHRCGHVLDRTNSDILPQNNKCPKCRVGTMVQLRFVKVHSCGAIEPLTPYFCTHCRSSNNVALETRGSERISNFRWICRDCGSTSSVFAGRCRQCNQDNNMSIEVHRSGRTFYPHSTVLLNQPSNEMTSFLRIEEWPYLASASYFELPETKGRKLYDFHRDLGQPNSPQDTGITNQELDVLMQKQLNGQLTAEQVLAEMQLLRNRRVEEKKNSSPGVIKQKLIERSGVSEEIWSRAGQEMLEAVMPAQSSRVEDIFTRPTNNSQIVSSARRIGLSKLSLIKDFPITIATYGYSRVDYRPDECRLNPFQPDIEHNGKLPIFVDLVQADALFFKLDHDRVIKWLETNNYPPTLPTGSDATLARQAYFIQLFDSITYGHTLTENNPQARLVFGLLHTFSHICIKQAALLCGLDRTSLSEYILPRTLSFALYCNHRAGATIGALVSLYEQSLAELLYEIRNSRHCVYDPVCGDNNGSCHACTHLAETSCRHFNLNLGRAFLFGGNDPILGRIRGYFDPSL